MQFFAKNIEYLGYIIDKEGWHISSKRTEGIDKATKPNHVKELQFFCGSLNYFAICIKNMATVLNPLIIYLKNTQNGIGPETAL